MKARVVALLCSTALLAGCNGRPSGASDPMAQAVKRENEMRPAGRFVSAGKREYNNGTEIYFLDTATGQVCWAFVPNDAKDPYRTCTESVVVTGL